MSLIEPFIGYLLAFGGVAIGIVSVYFSGKKSGEKDAVIDDLVANKEAQKEARKDVKEIADDSDDNLANRL